MQPYTGVGSRLSIDSTITASLVVVVVVVVVVELALNWVPFITIDIHVLVIHYGEEVVEGVLIVDGALVADEHETGDQAKQQHFVDNILHHLV
jgi:hypothetical protein